MIELRQLSKSLHGASFCICDDSRQVVGSVSLHGGLGKMGSIVKVTYLDEEFHMSPITTREAKADAGGYIKTSPFRPYRITEDISGVAFRDITRAGLMSSYTNYTIKTNDGAFYMYFVGFGKNGICAPVYREQRYIGDIRKSAETIDDLHNFYIFTQECGYDTYMLAFAIYLYTLAYYIPGREIRKGKHYQKVTTKNKNLLAKCKVFL